MKKPLLLLGLLCARMLAADSVPVFPPEIKMTTGAVLHEAKLQRFAGDYVVVRHAAGVDSIFYKYIAEPARTQILACKAAAAMAKPAPAVAPVTPSAANEATVIEGQMFVVTRGAGNYKLGGVNVYAFPMYVFQDGMRKWELGVPLAKATTDADGKFKLQLPNKEPFFLYARSWRDVGREFENYQWLFKSSDITDRSAVLLTGSNMDTRSIDVNFEDK